jgi:hypothetical protein
LSSLPIGGKLPQSSEESEYPRHWVADRNSA